MSIQSQIDRISGAVQDAFAALTEKGVTVPADANVTGLADLIAAIEAGGGGESAVTGTFIAADVSVAIEGVLIPGKTPIAAAVYEAQTGTWYTSTTHTTPRLILERVELATDGDGWWRTGIRASAGTQLPAGGGGGGGSSTAIGYFTPNISGAGANPMNGNTETGTLYVQYLIAGRRYVYILLYEGDLVTT